jgi:hypothetical protein
MQASRKTAISALMRLASVDQFKMRSYVFFVQPMELTMVLPSIWQIATGLNQAQEA